MQPRPAHLPADVAWPDVYQIVDGLADISRMNHPYVARALLALSPSPHANLLCRPFVSPVLFPDAQDAFPARLAPIAPVVAAAHPAITAMTCALTHPSDPSCLRTFVHYWLDAFPRRTPLPSSFRLT